MWCFLMYKISHKLVGELEPNVYGYNSLIRFRWSCPTFQGHSGAKYAKFEYV